MKEDGVRGLLTEVILGVTGTPSTRPSGALWAMGKVVVLIANILEEVNILFVLEDASGNTMNYGVSPALKVPV